MRRIAWVLLLTLLLTACAGAGADRKAPVVAVLISDTVRQPKVDGLKAGLAALGYGHLQVEVYNAGGDKAALPAVAARMVADRPAVLAAGGGVEAVALQEATRASGLPVVLLGVASTVRTGLVQSLVRPGGNLTGVDNQHAELSAKRLELLTKLVPGVRRVLLLYDPAVIPGRHALEVSREAAGRLGLTVETLAAETQQAALDGLRTLKPGDFDAALLLPAAVLESAARPLAAEFDRLRLPVAGPLDLGGESGLLAAYGVSMERQGRQAAPFVVKLLQGQEPGAIPVETPDNPELVVDLRVARRLGLTLSPVGMAFARTIGTEGGDRP